MKIFAKLVKELLLYAMVYCKVFLAGITEPMEATTKNVAKEMTLPFTQKFVILGTGSREQCPALNDLLIQKNKNS